MYTGLYQCYRHSLPVYLPFSPSALWCTSSGHLPIVDAPVCLDL